MIDVELKDRLVSNLRKQIELDNCLTEGDIFSEDEYNTNYFDVLDADNDEVFGMFLIDENNTEAKEMSEYLNENTNGKFFYKDNNVYYAMTCMCNSIIRDFEEMVINGRDYC